MIVMSKPIGVRIDSKQEEIWKKFKEFVAEKYGKKHTVLGNELVKALQLYLELYEKIGSKEPEIQIIKERAGDIELMTLKEISYDLLKDAAANGLLQLYALDANEHESIRNENIMLAGENLR